MNVSETGLAVNKRFFHTLDVLKQMRMIRGMNTFATKHNINPWNLFMAKKEPDKHFINAVWLSYLVTDYGVSADYLLTGVGSIIKSSEDKQLLGKQKV